MSWLAGIAEEVDRHGADAVASVGAYRIYPALDAPATPERILMAVERVKRQAGLPAQAAA